MITIPNPTLYLPQRLRRGAAALWRETDGGWYGPRGSCGCCCSIFSDDFNRADDTDLGSKWTETSGSWTITSNTLRTTSTSAVCLTTIGDIIEPHKILCHVTGASGDRPRVIWAYEDANNYWYAEVIYGTAFRVYERSGGTDTQRHTDFVPVAGTTYIVEACLAEDGSLHVALRRSDNGLIVSDVQLVGYDVADGECGVGTGTTASAAMYFDDFTVDEVSEDCESCTSICAGCNNIVIPWAWDITLPVLLPAHANTICDAGCAELSGATVRCYFVGRNSSQCFWAAFIEDGCGSGVWTQLFLLLNRGNPVPPPHASLLVFIVRSTSQNPGTGTLATRFFLEVPGSDGLMDCAESYEIPFLDYPTPPNAACIVDTPEGDAEAVPVF